MIDHFKEHLYISVRKTCAVLGFRRQSYYKRKGGHRPEEADEQIASLLHELVKRFVAWGFWMIFYYLRHQGHAWNHKKVYRIWKSAGLHLQVPKQRPKIRRVYQALLAPSQINMGWALDFVHDWVVGPGQERVRIINIIDECSRKVLWSEAHHSISASKLVRVLEKVKSYRGGLPQYIRCDNGPELISDQLKSWAGEKVELRHIQAGKPSQNGIIERLNGTLRKECLNLEWFGGLAQLNEHIQEWSVIYNTMRPHSSIGYQTPEGFEMKQKELYSNVLAP